MVDADDDPAEAVGAPAVAIWNSPARLTSNATAPRSQNTSNFSVFGWPNAMRDTLRSPVAPPAKRTEKLAQSSFSTGSRSSLTSTWACPTTCPSGFGRSPITVVSAAPVTDSTGPSRNSAVSARWLPRSASAPEPGPPR